MNAIFLFCFGLTQSVFAKNYGLDKAAETADYATGTGTDIYSMVNMTINGVLATISFIFFYYVIKAGLQWMTAQGNKDAIASAKTTIINSTLGLAILLAAYGLTNFVIDALNQ